MTRGLLVFLCALTSSPAAEWPQWRGPDRNGISSERVPTTWPAEGPKVLWRAAVGTGFSSFSVSQGRVYTMGNTNDLTEFDYTRLKLLSGPHGLSIFKMMLARRSEDNRAYWEKSDARLGTEDSRGQTSD